MTNSNPKLEEIKYINWLNSRFSSINDDDSKENESSNELNIGQIDRIGDNLTDGIILLKVFNMIHPEIIEWKKIDQKANNKFKQIQNCNYLITKMKEKAMPIASLGGRDIVDGSQKRLFGALWLLMREEYIKENGVKSDEEIKNWADQFIYNVAANDIEADEPDYQPLRIMLYMSQEAEIFMNFSDDDDEEIECPEFPQNFDILNLQHESYKEYNLEQLVTYTNFYKSLEQTMGYFSYVRRNKDNKMKLINKRNLREIVSTKRIKIADNENIISEPDLFLFDNLKSDFYENYKVQYPRDEIRPSLNTIINDQAKFAIDNFNDQMSKNNVDIDRKSGKLVTPQSPEKSSENQSRQNKDHKINFDECKTPKKLLQNDLKMTSWNQINKDKNTNLVHRQSIYKENSIDNKNSLDINATNRNFDKNDSPLKQIENDIKDLIQLHSQEPNSIKKNLDFNKSQDSISNEKENQKIKKKVKVIETSDVTSQVEDFRPNFEPKKSFETFGEQNNENLGSSHESDRDVLENKRRAHKRNRITGNYYKGERPEEDYYIGNSNRNFVDDENTSLQTKNDYIGNSNRNFVDDENTPLQTKNEYKDTSNQNFVDDENTSLQTKNEYKDTMSTPRKEFLSEDSVEDNDSEFNIKSNKKRFHKKNRPTGNTYTYQDDHAYQNYDKSELKFMNSEYFIKKQGKLSLLTVCFDNQSIIENSPLDRIRHTKYSKNVDSNEKSPYMLQHKLSFQLEHMNEKQSKLQGKMKDELLAKYILEKYPNEKSFKFQVSFLNIKSRTTF